MVNYNNSKYVKITKSGYSAVDGAEWKCLSGNCARNTYDHDNVTYTYSDFCDVSEGDCTVVLGVNWRKNKVYIKYNVNGGTAGVYAPGSGSYGETVTVSNPTKSGWKFDGWTVTGEGASINGTDLTIGSGNITLTANWTANLVEYIDYLYDDSNLRSSNALIKDDTSDTNTRYVGSTPNNYIRYNDELWRIIGVFNVSNGSTMSRRVKLIKDTSLINVASFDSSSTSDNSGYGINEWSQADIKTLLNDYYAGSSNSCKYCNGSGQSSCSNDCSGIVSKLGVTAGSLIENVVWNLGAIPFDDDPDDIVGTVLSTYNKERGTRTGRQCNYGSGGNCTDSVTRTTKWTGKVGLIYPSDYGYASTDSSCYDNITYNDACGKNNWLTTGYKYWTITPRDSTYYANSVWYVTPEILGDNRINTIHGVRPSVYLRASVSIKGGTGTSSDPYEFDIE